MIPFLLGLACGGGGLPTTTIRAGDLSITVEVADDAAERERGLMYRDRLGKNDGMLFVYPDAQERNFWMKDTRIPLSIAYLDADGRVIRIADMLPLNLEQVPSGGPAKFALEMNRGWFTTNGVKTGDVVRDLPSPAAP